MLPGKVMQLRTRDEHKEAYHMKLGTTEIILIIVLALVLFGGSKVAGLGGALGKSIKDFKSAVKEDDAKESDKDEEKA